jgi:hypothetical protein
MAIVLADISTAPTVAGSAMPQAANAPAATGIAKVAAGGPPEVLNHLSTGSFAQGDNRRDVTRPVR